MNLISVSLMNYTRTFIIIRLKVQILKYTPVGLRQPVRGGLVIQKFGKFQVGLWIKTEY